MRAKPWYSSKTLISAFVGLLGFAANLFHVDIADLLPAVADASVRYLSDLFTLAGLIGTIVGRFKAREVLVPSKAAAANHDALRVAVYSQADDAVAQSRRIVLPGVETPSADLPSTEAPTAAPSGASASASSDANPAPPDLIDQ